MPDEPTARLTTTFATRMKADPEFYVLVSLIAISIVMRWIGLDHWPGINGDEAWSAAQARLFLHGEPFTWITPTRRILTPTYSLPILLLQVFFPPNARLLRLPAFLAGALTAIFSYPLLKRVLDRSKARIAAAWTACLALHIAYSRIGWEMSQTLPATLLVIYFALRGSLWKTALALIAAIIIHTIDVFLFPIALAPILYDLHQKKKLPRPVWLILLGICAWPSALLLLSYAPPDYAFPVPTAINCYRFLIGFSRIFSGVLVFSDFSATLRPVVSELLDSVAVVGILLLFVTGIRRIKGRNLAFTAGVAVSCIFVFAVAGDLPVRVGYERYSLWLALPSIVVFALLWPQGVKPRIVAYALSMGMLASFTVLFFLPMADYGGSPTRPYHAGKLDPKFEAAKWMSADAGTVPSVSVVAEDWNIQWVVVDCLLDHPRRKLEMSVPGSVDLEDILVKRNGYLAGYANGSLESAVNRLREMSPSTALVEKDFPDSAGLPFVKVWKVLKPTNSR
jgi:hypothetical protein